MRRRLNPPWNAHLTAVGDTAPTMSQQNIEIVRRAVGVLSFDAADEAARVASVERLDPEVEFEEDRHFPEARTYRGREEVLNYFTQFVSQFERFVFSVEDLVDGGGDNVLVCLRISGVGKGSYAEFEIQPGWMFTVRDGRVVRIRAYLERSEALEAARQPR